MTPVSSSPSKDEDPARAPGSNDLHQQLSRTTSVYSESEGSSGKDVRPLTPTAYVDLSRTRSSSSRFNEEVVPISLVRTMSRTYAESMHRPEIQLSASEALSFPYLTTSRTAGVTNEYTRETPAGEIPLQLMRTQSRPWEAYDSSEDLESGPKQEISMPSVSGEKEPGIKDISVITWKTGDVENPHNWNNALRWYITFSAAFAVVSAAFGSAVATGDFGGTMNEFNVSLVVVSLTVTLMVCGFGLGPLIWSPLSEIVGRRPVWFFAYGLYIVFNIPCALSPNIGGLLASRFLAGIFGSVPLTLAGGAIADVWSVSERGFAVALFAAAPYGGPVLGPLIGGFVGQGKGWRWLYWVNMIWAAVSWVLIILVPETYSPVLLKRKAQKIRQTTGQLIYTEQELFKASFKEILNTTLLKPFSMLVSEPILALMSLYIAWIYGALYAFFFSFPVVYHDPYPKGYGYSDAITGLTFIPVLIGVGLALVVTPYLEKIYAKTVRQRNGKALPEDRLVGMMVGVFFIPIALFIFGWTAPPYVHPSGGAWVGPCSAGIPFGMGMVIIYFSANAYIIDAFPRGVASALAAKTVVRSGAGAAMPLFITAMFHNLGNGWASSLFGFISIAMIPIPFVFYKYGASIRARSRSS